MRYTLLDMTQAILSSLDSDEINSIGDSPEADQVTKIIRTAYFDLITPTDFPEHYTLVTLDASGSASKPVLMTLPSTVSKIEWVKYNKETTDDTNLTMQEVYPLPLKDFLEMTYQLTESDSNVDTFTHTVGTDTYTFMYQNDTAPTYYTTFDDSTLIFDSYDNTVDTTLQKSKSLCYGRSIITFTMSDSFEFDLDERHQAVLLNEAKSLAWAELKQTTHPKAEQAARRGRNNIARTKWQTQLETPLDRAPNYGRK